MKNIKVVIGALFGDEGKGLMTDYFCQQGRTLNVRFNGTAQASHTVHRNNKSHIFKTIGAGSFQENVDTYLSKEFVINPIILKEEVCEFIKEYQIKPNIYIHKDCKIVTPYDMILNQQIELNRKVKHGSCGCGLFETIKRYKSGYYWKLNDFNFENILDKIIENSNKVFFKQQTVDDSLNLKEIKQHFIKDYLWMLSYCQIVDDKILENYENIVFEGGQGLSLCEDNLKYFPHLTPSQTGMKNVSNILSNVSFDYDLEICYVMRSYATRHGNGLLNHECKKEELGSEVIEKTNVFNTYQGNFRFGYLDLEEVKENIEHDLKKISKGISYTTSLAITHLDQTNYFIKTNKGNILPLDLSFNNLYFVNGETAQNVEKCFKKERN